MKDKSLFFYDLLDYPLPTNAMPFRLLNGNNFNDIIDENKHFSWKEKDLLMNTYISYLNSFGILFKNLPFVQNIYLCNSITFNKLDENSDIDFLFVCKNNRLLVARFFASIILTIFGLRWFKNKKALKFDLGFFVTQDSLDFYSQTIKPYDVYFFYWIAHLVPLYSENPLKKEIVYTENKWLSQYLTGWEAKQNIYLGNNFFSGRGFFKKFIEKIHNGFLGNIMESLLKAFWLPIILMRSKSQGNKDDILISDNSLRFYRNSFREKINQLFKKSA